MENLNVVFYSKDKKINPDLFSKDAELWAEKICNAGLKIKIDPKTKKEKKVLEKNKISQIRKFYDEVLRFSNLLKAGENYQSIFPYIKMLNAKVVYAEGRNLVTREFTTFIKQSLEQLKEDDLQTFHIFENFFEAFMGYYRFYESQYKGEGEQ
ncbi:MAG: type III-A CRISPR-associated protein Csm2 [Thermodesulfovibrio sp.]|nr:type III-A CRISPR-associated protein Csm2 [Thermodesulfovibrio sp.]MDW7998473.1 type III-A CRISPR-associated protein Csm2 [Thermodesulfovibrio sp.]